MNKAIITTGVLFGVVNLLIGLIVTAYGSANIAVTTVVIALTTVLLLAVNGRLRLRAGYKVSLSLIIPVIGAIQYFMGLFMPDRFSDNWVLIALIITEAVEAFLLIAANSVSNKVR